MSSTSWQQIFGSMYALIQLCQPEVAIASLQELQGQRLLCSSFMTRTFQLLPPWPDSTSRSHLPFDFSLGQASSPELNINCVGVGGAPCRIFLWKTPLSVQSREDTPACPSIAVTQSSQSRWSQKRVGGDSRSLFLPPSLWAFFATCAMQKKEPPFPSLHICLLGAVTAFTFCRVRR